jgi:hypothetical protein
VTKFDRAEAAGVVHRSTRDLHQTFDADPPFAAIPGDGQLNTLKKAGLYVEVDDEGKLTSEPSQTISRDMAAKCLFEARSALEQVFKAEVVRSFFRRSKTEQNIARRCYLLVRR